MKLQKWLLSLGMVGAIAFFLNDFLGNMLLKGYNPITTYLSELTADGTPYAGLMRAFILLYQVSFLLFTITLCIKSFYEYCIYTRIGYIFLFGTSCLSIFTFNVFPMTVNTAINLQNILHLILAITILTLPHFALFLLSFGYKRDKIRKLGRFSLIAAILYLLFNLLHLIGIQNGWNILGLIQRLSVYTFQIFTFYLSWTYVFRQENRRRTKRRFR